MIDRSDTERLVRSWLEPGPTTMPDRVVDVVADRISRQRQRRPWRLPWRLPVKPQMKVLVGLAAVLVIAFTGWSMLPRQGGVGGPSPSPSPATSPSPRPITLITPRASLKPGTYLVATLPGHVAFTVPDGWSVPQVGPGASDFTLHLNAGPADDSVKVMFDMRRAAKDAACTEAPEPGAGATAKAIVDDLIADANLRVTSGPITIGPTTGYVVDVTLAPTAKRTCPFSSGAVSVPLIVDTLPGAGPFWGVGPKEKVRLVILDRPGASNAVVVIDSAAGASFDQLVSATMPVVQTLTFSAS